MKPETKRLVVIWIWILGAIAWCAFLLWMFYLQAAYGFKLRDLLKLI